jgi:hypothetical protein
MVPKEINSRRSEDTYVRIDVEAIIGEDRKYLLQVGWEFFYILAENEDERKGKAWKRETIRR